MMHAHIYPYTPMHEYKNAKHGDAPPPTHAYYRREIRIQNRDAHTDSQTHIRTSPTYVQDLEYEVVEQLQ